MFSTNKIVAGKKPIIKKEFCDTQEFNLVKFRHDLQVNWHNQDSLAAIIMDAIDNANPLDLLPASKHLFEIDTYRERAVGIYGIALMKDNQASEAATIFSEFMHTHGKSAVILINFANASYQCGKHEKAIAALEEGLAIDPNLENGLQLWLRLRRNKLIKRYGEDRATLKALEEANHKFGGKLINMYFAQYYGDKKEYSTSLKYMEKL